MRAGPIPALRALALGCAALACGARNTDHDADQGATDDAGASTDPVAEPLPPLAAVAPLRRLTRVQYANTVRDRLGPALPDDLDIGAMLPLDDVSGGFAANATPVTDPVLEQYERAAETIAAAVDPAALGSDDAILAGLAPGFFRRQLRPDEHAELLALAQSGGARLVLRTLLLSPAFLYRVEWGEPVAPNFDVRLDDFAIATRLALLVWAAGPDDDLLAVAAAGGLRDADGRAQQLSRMLADPRARRGLAQMHVEWLQLQRLSPLVKDRNVFPNFSEAVGAQMLDEVANFVDEVVRRGDGTLAALLTSRRTIAGPGVVFWYGQDATVEPETPPPDAGKGAAVLTLDPHHRAGILTLVAVQAAHAKPDRSDPVRRGALIRDRLLCQPLAAAPPDVPAAPAAPIPGASLREQLGQHSADPSCAVCHDRIDPIGFALESFDAMGRFVRDDAAGNPIDDRGEIVDADVEGPVVGAVALAEALAASAQVQRCYATQWFRYVWGRIETPEDAPVLDAIYRDFSDSGGHIETLLAAIVTSDAFAYRRLP